MVSATFAVFTVLYRTYPAAGGVSQELGSVGLMGEAEVCFQFRELFNFQISEKFPRTVFEICEIFFSLGVAVLD